MKIKVLKRRGISEAVKVERKKTLEELVEENDNLLEEFSKNLNEGLTAIKVINRILRDKIADEKNRQERLS